MCAKGDFQIKVKLTTYSAFDHKFGGGGQKQYQNIRIVSETGRWEPSSQDIHGNYSGKPLNKNGFIE